jgi:type 1 glutamine amidotransferase/nicotinamidase-related amidase
MRRILLPVAVLCLCFGAVPAHAAPLNVCLVSGSFEYKSDEALGIFKDWLDKNCDVNCTLLCASGWENIPGLEALDTCDVALFFTRRLELKGEQLDRIKRYCESGRPLVAVRTASHGFQKWLAFDREVLGGNYKGHLDEGPTIETFVMPDGKVHPILKDVEPFRSRYSLYKNPDIANDATLLMMGRTPESGGREPIAWTRMYKGGRVFYTSLGGVGDFENSAFARMIANALFWTADRPVLPKELPGASARVKKPETLHLAMRTRAADAADGAFGEAVIRDWAAAETAIIVCDMWDKHWCDFATAGVDALAPKVDNLLKKARAAGVQVIHCPSETLGFYQDSVQRRRMQAAPPAELPAPKEVKEPPLPIHDKDGGCPGIEKFYMAWTRQHAAIVIADEDGMSDNGREIYNYFRQNGIQNVLYVGVHTNMCVLGRSFGIRQMTRWGLNCALVRDLTDSMYNPAYPPKVSHDEGTELIVEHIEKYWCPSITSAELVAGLPVGITEK